MQTHNERVSFIWSVAALNSHLVTKGLDPTAPTRGSGIPWIGQISAHWERRRLKHAVRRMIDCAHKTDPYYDDGEYLVVRTTNVKNGKLELSDAKYTDGEGYAEWTARGKPEPGDVILTREAPAGEACLEPPGMPVCLGQRTVLLEIDKQRLNPQYLVPSSMWESFVHSSKFNRWDQRTRISAWLRSERWSASYHQ